MKLTRDRVLLTAGLVCVGAGAVLLFTPGAVPGLGPLEPLTDIDTATQVGLLLGLVVAIVAAFQMRRTAQDSLDRSGLRSAPPEQPRDATVPRPSDPLARTYRRVSDRIGRSGRSGWHVVAYGRRVRYTEDATTRRPDPPAAPLRPPGAVPEPDIDRTRRSAAQQDGGQPLRKNRRYRAGNHSTGNRAPHAGEDGRRATEHRRAAEGRRPTESEENGRQPVQETPEPPEGPGTGQQVTEHREPKMEEQQQRAGPQDRVDSDRGGRVAWEQRPTATQFRQRSREQLLELLDDVAETAQDTYATATGCDPATAERAVAAGEWTDNRVAAAFLATDRDAPGFTLTERAVAWLSPQRTLDRRLAQTLDAVERHADSYLTYKRRAEEGSQIEGGGEQE